jgi:hypothetical protein
MKNRDRDQQQARIGNRVHCHDEDFARLLKLAHEDASSSHATRLANRNVPNATRVLDDLFFTRF